MDALISVDMEGVPSISILTDKASRWFRHRYHASFLVNDHIVTDPAPFKFLGHTPQDIYDEMIEAGLKVSIRRVSYW